MFLIEKYWPMSETRECIIGITTTLKSAKHWAQGHAENYKSPKYKYVSSVPYDYVSDINGTDQVLIGSWKNINSVKYSEVLYRNCSDGSIYYITKINAEINTEVLERIDE